MLVRRVALLLQSLICVSAAWAQFPVEKLGPGDEYERELAPRLAVPSSQATPLLAEAARRRVERDGISEPLALTTVHRKLGLLALEQKQWKLAESHLNAALQLAGKLADAPLLIDLLLTRYHARLGDDNRGGALEDAQEAWSLAKKIGDAPRQLHAGFAVTHISHKTGRIAAADPYFEEMLALPGADQLSIELSRAELALGGQPKRAAQLWQGVADRAGRQGAPAIHSRALDVLGSLAVDRSAWPEAVEFFAAAEKIVSERVRSPNLWYDYSRALSGVGDYSGARRALDIALGAVNAVADPKEAADIEDARATVLARFGEHAAAYEALRRVQKLRAQAANTGVRMQAVRMVPMNPVATVDQAAALAAARAALRDAELARTRLNQRLALIGTGGALLVAAALGLALFYKRRAARALLLAKDAAELRAERTHWQMLRYQLNPHFLHNSLASLSGLIVLDPESARRTAGRLSDFCRLALQRSTGDLRKVDEEMQLLAAFADVEQAGAGDSLRVRFSVDPAARSLGLPPLLLQPLVENALKYGEPATDGVREVVITARCTADRLLLEVANTGAWIESSKQANRPPRTGTGLGLSNVRERLGRLGAAATLETVIEPGWVRIRVTLPRWEHDRIPSDIAAVVRAV